MKRKERRNRAIAWLVLMLSICVMTIFGYQLGEVWQTYREGNESYNQLAHKVRPGGVPALHARESAGAPLRAAGNGGGQAAGGARPDGFSALHVRESAGSPLRAGIDIPDLPLDFAALQEINPDAAAWLYCPDTVIDYPVMRAADYSYYLHHLPDGKYNANGTLFIDYNWVDFSDKLTVIYGHNMKSGRMFGSLTNYKEQAYFEEHPFLYLYSAGGEKYRVDLMYGCVIGAGQWRERAFMFEENIDALMAYAAYNTTFVSEARYARGDRVIALSTCSYEFDNARYVVIGVLRPEYGDDRAETYEAMR